MVLANKGFKRLPNHIKVRYDHSTEAYFSEQKSLAGNVLFKHDFDEQIKSSNTPFTEERIYTLPRQSKQRKTKLSFFL